MQFQYRRAATLEEAIGALSEGSDGTKVVAGGIGLSLMIKEQLVAVDQLIDIRSIEELSGIQVTSEGLHIGGAVTLQEIAESAVVREHCASLAEACAHVGNVRVRNWATIGGNLAHADYASDPPTALAAVRASCVVAGPGRATRVVSVGELIRGYYETSLARDEIIVRVVVPAAELGDRSVYQRFTSRTAADRPTVTVGLSGTVDRANGVHDLIVAVGATSGQPVIYDDFADIDSLPLTATVAKHVAERCSAGLDPIADHRGSAWYRKQVTATLVERGLRRLAQGGAQRG